MTASNRVQSSKVKLYRDNLWQMIFHNYRKQYGIKVSEITSKTSYGPQSTLRYNFVVTLLHQVIILLSHFSKQYDYKNADPTWVCFFCRKSSHYRGLGDLFGPYYVRSSVLKNSVKDAANVDSPKKGIKRRRKSEISGKYPKSNEIQGPTNFSHYYFSEPESAPVAAPEVGDKTEIWFHEDCFIWVPCTHLVGGRLVGMEEVGEKKSFIISVKC